MSISTTDPRSIPDQASPPGSEAAAAVAGLQRRTSSAANAVWRLLRLALWAMLVVLALPIVAPAGDLTGRVVLAPSGTSTAAAAPNPYPGMLGSLPPARGGAAAENVRDVVVSVHGVPAAAGRPARSERPTLTQKDQSFQPRVLGVPVGGSVEFPNLDPIFHNVFSYSKAKRFDLGKYGQGKSESVTFDKPGLVKVFCEIHSNMSAYIYVVDSPYVIQPDARGEFAFPGLPNGTYELQMWHPERGTRREQVTVTDSGTRVELAF
jgi:plastocyanin